MSNYVNKKNIYFFLWVLFLFQRCNFQVESQKETAVKQDYSLKKVPCIPDYLKYYNLDSLMYELINDSQLVNRKIADGYAIEITQEKTFANEIGINNSKMELPNPYFLKEGLYQHYLRTGLWKKYMRFHMNCWTLCENTIYKKNKVIFRQLVPSAENVYESELIGFPSCDSNFLRHREIEFKILYNNFTIKDSTRL